MDEFAKLFSAPDTGQVLVMLDLNEEGPMIQLFIKPGVSLSEIRMDFENSPEGVQYAIELFKKLDEEDILRMARDALEGPFAHQVTRTIH